MAQFLLKRSGTADKRPDPAQMALGELDLNYDAISGGVFYKDSGGTVVKVGPAQVSATAPNATPAGSAGNALGEFWYDTGSSTLCIWDGAAWQATGGGGGIPPSTFTACGDLIVGTGAGTYAALPIPRDFSSNVQNGCLLTTCSTEASGLIWITPPDPGIPCACITGQGALITGTAASTPVALSVGTAGQVLTVDLTCSEGLKWATPSSASNATPISFGLVLGSTDAYNATLGCCAGASLNGAVAYNVAIGLNASRANALALNNIAIGANALCANTAMFNSIAIGVGALETGESGNNNLAIGLCALRVANGASNNVAIGSNALASTSFGCCSIGIGIRALCSGTNAHLNTAIGSAALRSTSNGVRNVAVGADALALLSGTQNDNVAIGTLAGGSQTAGSCNVVVGACVQLPSLTGSCQLAIGFGSNYWLTGNSTKAIQPGAGIIDCAGSCGTNGQVLMSNGSNAICWGSAAGSQATPTVLGTVYGRNDANFNTAYGQNALACMGTSGFSVFSNTAIGRLAMGCSANGNQNVAVGLQAMCNTSGAFFNVAVGTNALASNSSGQCNVAVGWGAAESLTGSWCNIAIGPSSLSAGGTMFDNVAIGANSLGATTGCGNIAIGCGAGSSLTTGCRNVIIGCGAQAPVATGSCQLALGYSATCNWLTGCSDKAIKPGAGIIDCADSTGDAGQVLMSNGSNALCWGTVTAGLDPNLLCCCNPDACGEFGGNLIYGKYVSGVVFPAPLYPGHAGQILCSTGSQFNPIAYCNANYVCGACFSKGSIPVGCNQTGGGVGEVSIQGQNDPGISAGYYTDIPLTGGSGTGVTANVNVIFTPYFPILDSIEIVKPGSGYLSGNVLGITINSVTLTATATVTSLNSSTIYNYSMLSVGTNGQVLTADSTCTNGVNWIGPGQSSNCNTLLGANAGTALTSGSNNILIGCCAGTTTGGVSGALTTETNRIVMGNSAHTCAQIQIAWTTTSDVRDKALDPAGVPYGLLFVEQLEPIAYRWCDRCTNTITDEKLRYGFSAQNVRDLEGDEAVIVSDDNPEKLMITDQHLLPVLVNAIRELSERNKVLEERIAALEVKA